MQQIISFLLRNKNFLLYLFLLIIALVFTIQSHSYHRSKFINSANFLSGGVYEILSDVEGYFKLKSRNQELVEENARLRQLLQLENSANSLEDFTSLKDANYDYIPAKVVKNSYSKTDNIITAKIGEKDSILPDMGVITSKGIVGVIDNTSTSYSTILSVLNTAFQTNAKLKNTEHFGTLEWDGKDPNLMQVINMQEQAPVAIGDTIETSGQSAIFPKGITIGTVESKTLDASKNYYTLTVRLINDMTDIGHVYIIKNKDLEEIKTLQSPEIDE